MTVVVCIITFRRLKELQRLLRGLNHLVFTTEPPELSVLVVDNDASGHACTLCASLELKWPLRCVVEPTQGIPFARNRAVREAKDADFLAFIDDDEVPAPSWLEHLLSAQRRFKADAISGPVIPHLPDEAPLWLVEGGFLNRPRHQTGQVRPSAATNNLLLRTVILDSIPGPFDTRMRYSGGSDTRLTRQLTNQGYRIIWANDAIVEEYIPPHRLRPQWILQRAYRSGNGFALIEMLEGASVSARVTRALKGIVHLNLGLIHALFRGLLSKSALLHALHKMCLGAGMITGALHWWYEEYKNQGS